MAETRNYQQIETRIEVITPEEAEAMLGKNISNRALSKDLVRKMSQAILNGEWSLNGESLKFSKSGKLLDGQHRLSAVVSSGQAITTMVVYGLDETSQETVDIGKKRTLADILKLRGVSDAGNMAALLNRVHQYRSGTLTSGKVYNILTPQAAISMYEEDEDKYSEAIRSGYRLRKGINVSPSVGGALWAVVSEIDYDDAEYFFEKATRGVMLEESDPILLLRRKILSLNEEKGVAGNYKLALLIKAWNFYREGVSIKALTYRPGGKMKEGFPVAK